MANKGRPGVMMYFDVRPGLESLTTEEKGILFDAIMDYAELGILPEFASPALRIAWGFIQPRIDSDAARYETIRERRRQAINKRWAKEEPVDPDVQMYTNECGCIQTIPTQLSSTTTQHNSSQLSSTTTQHSTTQSAPVPPSGEESDFRSRPAYQSAYAAIERWGAAKQEDSSEE